MTAPPAAVPPRPRRRRHAAFVVTALLLGLVAAVGALELALRLWWSPPAYAEFQQAGMYVATADGDVALQPGYRGTLTVDGTVTVAIDALGMRTEPGAERRAPAAKRAGETRVLVLGDSMVWGYGVEAAAALPRRLEAHLRAAGRDVTAGNAGVPGYGSRHVALQLARLDAPFGADAFVVCGCLGNDALDDAQPQRTVFAGLQLQGAWARLVHDSWRARLMYRSRAALWLETWLATNRPDWSLVRQLRFDPVEEARAIGFVPDLLRAGLFLDAADGNTPTVPTAPPPIPRHLATLRESLQAMRTAAGTRPFVFVVLPTSFQVIESRRVAELQRLGLDPTRFQRGLAQQRWLDVATAAGAVALDATPILAAEPDPESLFLSDGGHFSARGNDVVAAWLVGAVAPLLPAK